MDDSLFAEYQRGEGKNDPDGTGYVAWLERQLAHMREALRAYEDLGKPLGEALADAFRAVPPEARRGIEQARRGDLSPGPDLSFADEFLDDEDVDRLLADLPAGRAEDCRRVLWALDLFGSATVKQLQASIDGLLQNHVRAVLRWLEQLGEVEQPRNGWWMATKKKRLDLSGREGLTVQGLLDAKRAWWETTGDAKPQVLLTSEQLVALQEGFRARVTTEWDGMKFIVTEQQTARTTAHSDEESP